MPDSALPVDARSRFVRLLGVGVVTAILAGVAWGLLSLAGHMLGRTQGMRCQNNLKSLVEAMTIYRSQYGGQLPAYLALLLPHLEDRAEAFVCPADPDKGAMGCRPAWLRSDDEQVGDQAFAHVDLDGPGLDPGRASDSVRCSYLYAANGYPCGLVGFERTWREEFDRQVGKFGKDTPMVRCYHHLPERYVGGGEAVDAEPKRPDPAAAPTYNITADLQVREYPLEWQSAPRFGKSGPADPQ